MWSRCPVYFPTHVVYSFYIALLFLKTLLLLNYLMTVSIQFFLLSIYVHFRTYCTCSWVFWSWPDFLCIAFSDSVSQTSKGMAPLSTWHWWQALCPLQVHRQWRECAQPSQLHLTILACLTVPATSNPPRSGKLLRAHFCGNWTVFLYLLNLVISNKVSACFTDFIVLEIDFESFFFFYSVYRILKNFKSWSFHSQA